MDPIEVLLLKADLHLDQRERSKISLEELEAKIFEIYFPRNTNG